MKFWILVERVRTSMHVQTGIGHTQRGLQIAALKGKTRAGTTAVGSQAPISSYAVEICANGSSVVVPFGPIFFDEWIRAC